MKKLNHHWCSYSFLTWMLKWIKIKIPLFYTEQEEEEQQKLSLEAIRDCQPKLLFSIFLTFKNDGFPPHPPLPRLWDSAPSVHSYLELKARNSCLLHCSHFPSLLPVSSLTATLLCMCFLKDLVVPLKL